MDILTQGLLGSALSLSIADEEETRLAAGIGFFAGLLADADILISSSSDPLLALEYHRHFSHSIFFIPIGGLIAALILWPLLKRRLKFKRLYLFSLMGYSLSGSLDACTSYGTHLFWPLSDERVALYIISIIDPIFTGILLIVVLWSWLRYRPSIVYGGLILCSLYLVAGYVQLQRATELAQGLVSFRGHNVERMVVKPTMGNIFLWRSVYISQGQIYVDAVRTGISVNNLYPGESVPLFVPERDAIDIPKDSILYTDIQRFKQFSDGFIALDPYKDNVLTDVRYSMLPTSVKTLWGLSLDRSQVNKHGQYVFYRDNSAIERTIFWSMIIGK